MQVIGGDQVGIQPAGQLTCEQGVGELRVAIGVPSVKASAHLQVVEVYVSTGVGTRTHVNDPCGGTVLEQTEQQVGEEERGQVINAERAFEPIFGEGPAVGCDSGVVDEHVKFRQFTEPCGQVPYLG